jgi:Tol biopolymer transport system component
MRAAAMSRDGTRLSYSQGRRVANVWRVPILAQRAATWSDAHQITFDQAFIEYLDVSPEGTRLLISSDRSGNPDIWVLPVEGGDMEPVVSDPAPDWGPAWSPNGREVAFYSYRSGNRDVWVISLHGGAARQLTDNPAADRFPSWSPDGTQIGFASDRGGPAGIWITPARGGEATKIPGLGGRPYWSPHGKWLAVLSWLPSADAYGEVWRVSVVAAAPPRRLAAKSSGNCGDWSPDGRTFYFVGIGKNESNLHAVSIDGTSQRQMTVLTGRRGAMGCMTTDGRNLFFTWEEDLGDLWVMDVVGRD